LFFPHLKQGVGALHFAVASFQPHPPHASQVPLVQGLVEPRIEKKGKGNRRKKKDARVQQKRKWNTT